MPSPRWMKLLRDLRAARGRVAMMVLAMAAGVMGLATMLSTYTLLRREVPRNYLETHPASASLEVDGLDEALLAAVRRRPDIAAAQAATRATLRIEVAPGEWLPLMLFAVQDFQETRIGTLRPEAGAWPPAPGTLLLERDALALAGAHIGQPSTIRTRQGDLRAIPVMGTVHDPSLPPASSGKRVFGFTTPETLAGLGEQGGLRTLRILVKDRPMDVDAIERTSRDLALWLGQGGHPVREISIPPPGEHPHQRIMESLMGMLLIFSVLALILSTLLSASMIGGLLARQVRQIGIMKAVGARTRQIAGVYLAFVLLLGLLATGLGLPLGLAAGRAFTRIILMQILNFTLADVSLPTSVYLTLMGAGVLLPILIAAVPILGATRMTVRRAIDDIGAGSASFGTHRLDAWLSRARGWNQSLTQALRNAFRRRSRLFFTLALLGSAGALFIGSLNLKRASHAHLEEAAQGRRYDLEVILSRPEAEPEVLNLLASLPGVRRAESWPGATAAKSRPDGLVIERTYPDGGHNSLSLAAVPQGSSFLRMGLQAGRWLQAGDTEAVVINDAALHFFPGISVGDPIELTVRGRPAHLRLAGIARQPMSGATVFISAAGFSEVTDQGGRSRSFRVALSDSRPEAIESAAREIEQALGRAGINTGLILTEMMMRRDSDGHFDILLAAMIFISLLMAAVGSVGLASALSTSVTERTREFGIMRTLGATSSIVLRQVLMEGIFIGLMSWALALLLALPVSMALDTYLGRTLFDQAFPLVFSPSAALLWLGLVFVGALAASAYPSWKASRLTIRETLAYF